MIRLARIGGRAIHRIGRQTGKLRAIGDAAGIGASCVQYVLRKLRAQLREPLHDFPVTGLALRRQIDARQTEIAQRVLDHLALRGIEGFALMPQHIRVGRLQFGVLTEFRGIGGEQRNALVVGLAHRGGIGDGIQMSDGTPDAAEAVAQLFDGNHQRSERRARLGLELGQSCAVVG